MTGNPIDDIALDRITLEHDQLFSDPYSGYYDEAIGEFDQLMEQCAQETQREKINAKHQREGRRLLRR